MRHLVLALMIVLLPLRGWAGDAMATQMASAAITVETRASDLHEVAGAASHHIDKQRFNPVQAATDCAGHQASQQADVQTPQSVKGETCQACQACHIVALSASTIEVTNSLTPPQLRPTHAAAFTSAGIALGQKPPIS